MRVRDRALLAGYDAAKTLTDALALSGYTHRATRRTVTTQTREIVDASGAVVATLTAHEAWAWLRGGAR